MAFLSESPLRAKAAVRLPLLPIGLAPMYGVAMLHYPSGMRWAEAAHLSTGVQLADENLGERPMRFITDEHLAKLDEIRRARDPEQRFHPWMGRPPLG